MTTKCPREREVNWQYFYDLLFTKKNLKLVHIACHVKGIHSGKKCDKKKFYKVKKTCKKAKEKKNGKFRGTYTKKLRSNRWSFLARNAISNGSVLEDNMTKEWKVGKFKSTSHHSVRSRKLLSNDQPCTWCSVNMTLGKNCENNGFSSEEMRENVEFPFTLTLCLSTAYTTLTWSTSI